MNSNRYGIANSKIFITGGAGFIGSRIARELCDGNEIVLFDNLHNNALKDAGLPDTANIKLRQGDVRDLNAVVTSMDTDCDYVIHAAAIAGVDTVMADPMRVLEVNVKGTFNVTEAASKLTGLKKFVDFSTSEVFGSFAYNVDEGTINPVIKVTEPRWTYAMSKLIGEFVVHSHHLQNHMPTVTVRPFNIYGPNQVGVGAIHNFVKRALAGEDLHVHGDGTQIRSWCYVEDFIHGVLLAMSKEASSGKSYNIGNPRATVTVNQLARMIRDYSTSESEIVYKPLSYSDIAVRIPDITAARTDLGYEPLVDMEEGIQRTVEWYAAKSNS